MNGHSQSKNCAYCNGTFHSKNAAKKYCSLGCRILFNSTPEPNSGCWLWTGVCLKGYGRIGIWNASKARADTFTAHRIAYETWIGPIQKNLEIDHLCGVRCCVNPAHLEPVTASENVRRSYYHGVFARLPTHCKNGHKYEEGSFLIRNDGARRCRICRAGQQRRYQQNRKARQQQKGQQ